MSRAWVECDLGSVVGDLVKPQAAFTFRTTAGDGMLLSSNQGSMLASILLLTSLSGCVCVCVCVCVGSEKGYNVVPCVILNVL